MNNSDAAFELNCAAHEIFEAEQVVAGSLVSDPTNTRLNGALAALQHARTIVEKRLRKVGGMR